MPASDSSSASLRSFALRLGVGKGIPTQVHLVGRGAAEGDSAFRVESSLGGLFGRIVVPQLEFHAGTRRHGLVVGILPGKNDKEANKYIDIPIVTGFGHGRNIIVVSSSEVIIAIGGSFGTLSEISFALRLGIPVIGLNTWNVSDQIIKSQSPLQAVDKAFSCIANNNSSGM